jgi:hypothetical protein
MFWPNTGYAKLYQESSDLIRLTKYNNAQKIYLHKLKYLFLHKYNLIANNNKLISKIINDMRQTQQLCRNDFWQRGNLNTNCYFDHYHNLIIYQIKIQ